MNTTESLLSRRQALGLLGTLSTASVLGCMSDNSDSTDSSTTNTSATGTGTGSCTLIPQETVGPYPLSAILSNSAMLRQDITDGKTGVPLTLEFVLQNLNQGCQPITEAYLYVWHCDKDGLYSGYNQPDGNTLGQSFLRGIGKTDSTGKVSFSSIYPGWYNGRITHVHFQVFLISPEQTATATSQLAFPPEITQQVYASSLYAVRGQNTSVTSFAADNVFSDGTDRQMATISGTLESGLTASLVINVAI